MIVTSLLRCAGNLASCKYELVKIGINPRRACAARVTALGAHAPEGYRCCPVCLRRVRSRELIHGLPLVDV